MASGSLTIIQGSDITVKLTAKDSGGVVNDVSASSEIIFGIFELVSQTSNAILTKRFTLGKITLPNGGSEGRVDVEIADTDLVGVEPGSYEWQVRFSVGTKERVSQKGTLTLEAGGNFNV